MKLRTLSRRSPLSAHCLASLMFLLVLPSPALSAEDKSQILAGFFHKSIDMVEEASSDARTAVLEARWAAQGTCDLTKADSLCSKAANAAGEAVDTAGKVAEAAEALENSPEVPALKALFEIHRKALDAAEEAFRAAREAKYKAADADFKAYETLKDANKTKVEADAKLTEAEKSVADASTFVEIAKRDTENAPTPALKMNAAKIAASAQKKYDDAMLAAAAARVAARVATAAVPLKTAEADKAKEMLKLAEEAFNTSLETRKEATKKFDSTEKALDTASGLLNLARNAKRLTGNNSTIAKESAEVACEIVAEAREKCSKGGVLVYEIIPRIGNNPFDPQNPLGGGLTTPRTPMPGCTTPQPQPLIKTSPCPTGQTGSIIEQTPFFCMGGDWVPGAANITNSCTTTLPLGCSGPQPVSESQTQPCPGGQVGSIIQNRTYSCVNGAWTPGAWVTTSNSCTCNPAIQPQPDGQNIACPAGQTGTITQQRAYVCANGSWVPGTNWITVSNTCTTTQTGCATNYSGGNYVCGGTCGIASASLSVISGSNTMTATFGSNSNVPVNCSGATANPQSTNLIILGLPGHTCTFTGSSLTSFGINCHNNSGGTCGSTCSR